MTDGFVDLTYLVWSLRKNSPGTPGMLLKSYEEVDGVLYYYKMSSCDSAKGVYGHESVNEIVVKNVANILGIEVLQYEPVKCIVKYAGKEFRTLVTKSKNFRFAGEDKMTLEAFYDLYGNGEPVLEFMRSTGLDDYVSEVFLLDWLVYNRDRHGANLEVLLKDDNSFRMTPLFDHGLSLMFSCYDDESMKTFDRLANNPVNNYVGEMDLAQNLLQVNENVREKFLRSSFTLDTVFKDLEDIDGFVPSSYKELVFKMIKERADYAKKIFVG
jgi:hypothetical protein